MDKYARLKELLRQVCQDTEGLRPLLFQAVVKSVEEDSCTIDISGLELSDVRLKAVADGKTEEVMLAVPSPGSRVLVGSLTGDYRDLAVLSLEKFDRLLLGGDRFGGMVKVTELVESLNRLEQDINELKQAVAGWKPVAQDGGAALLTALGTWMGKKIPESRQEKLENTKIVQG